MKSRTLLQSKTTLEDEIQFRKELMETIWPAVGGTRNFLTLLQNTRMLAPLRIIEKNWTNDSVISKQSRNKAVQWCARFGFQEG